MSSVDWKKVTDEQVVQWQRKQHAVKVWIEEILGMELESESLAVPLNSGVVLCHVMRRLDERAIPRIQEDTKQVFKLKENVEFFLAACKDMGVPPYLRFRGPDLWDGTGMVVVVECLVALAGIVEQQYDGAPPLVINNEWKPPQLTDKETTNIKKQLIRIKEKPVSGTRPKVSAQIVLKKLALMAGNGVDINSYVPAFIRFQSLLRGHIQRQRYKAMVRNVAYRSRVAHEILDTESFYVKSLSQCINVWLNPLNDAIASGSPIISANDVKAIFSDIAVIHTFNSALYAEIECRVAKWATYECMGDIFLRLMDFLKVYTAYVQNFSTSVAVIERVSKKKDVAAYFQKCKEHPDGKSLDLASFLIMPVQRIPRYNLLLTDMFKNTWKEHPDYENLKKATEKIQSIAAFINERKREAENSSKTLEIANTITGNDKLNLTEAGRRYVREGHFNEGTKEEILAYLFTDIVVLCKPTKMKVLSRHSAKFKDYFKLQIAELKEGPAGSNSFEFIQLGKNKVLAKLVAKSKKEVDDWVKDFKNTKAELINQIGLKEKHSVGASEAKPKITAEERLKRRTRAEKAGTKLSLEEEEENDTLIQLKKRRDAIVSMIAEMKEPEMDKRARRQTKAQRKDQVRLYEQLQSELDEIDASLAQMKTLAPVKLKRKEALPEQSFSATQDLIAPVKSKEKEKSDDQATVQPLSNEDQPQSQPPPQMHDSDNSISTARSSSLSRKEEKKNEKLKKKEEKKRLKELKKAEKLRRKEGKKANGRLRRGTIATSSPTRDALSPPKPEALIITRDSPQAKKSSSGEAKTKSADDEPSSKSSSGERHQQQTPLKEKAESAEVEAKGGHDKQPAPSEGESKGGHDKEAPSDEKEESNDKADAPAISGDAEFYSYEELKKIKKQLDRTKLETYLLPDEFPAVFGMTKAEFLQLPGWKQKQKKDQKDLM